MMIHTNGVMISVIASGAVDRGFEQPKNYKIGICCFSAKHAASRRKSKYWFLQNQNNVREWSDKNVYPLTVVSMS